MTSSSVVHVIDDDTAARESLTFLLGTAEFEVKAYESAEAFLDAAPSSQTGCVITDVRMPEIDGIELLRRLRSQGIALPVIVITGHGDVPLAVEAIKAGAADFIEKPYESELLLEAVRSALSVQGADAKQEAERTEIQRRMADLSPRERQTLDGLVAGQPNKTIAYDLGSSPRTVEVHRARVMEKMGARSLPELVRMAIAAEQANLPNG